MTDRPKSIVFGEEEKLDIPLPSTEKQIILSRFMGLPERLITPAPESKLLNVLELFSGDIEDSFKAEVLSRSEGAVASNYVAVDLSSDTGLGHQKADVYKIIHELPPHSFDFIIMNHPPIWFTMARADRWRRQNKTRLATPTLYDAERFVQFIADCTRLIAPRKGNRISVAHGFAEQDINAVWRHASQVVPDYQNWFVNKVPTGQTAPYTLVDRQGHHEETLHFPEYAFQMMRY